MMNRAIVLLAAAMATSVHADAIGQLKSFLGNTQTVSSTFSQVVQGKKKTNTSTGTFELQRPGKFRWEYLKPYQQLIVSDGKKVWVYDADLEQVTERKLDQALGDTPAALLSGSNELEKGFSLKNLSDKDGLSWVEALPKQKEGTFEKIELGLQDNLLKRMILKDQFGQTTTLDFANIVKNPKIELKRFSFTPPAGTDIIKDKE
ncbi:outer membrane lipoprotein chaperone LolA [Leeia sp. TBRC 13508]|uniref:Outer-membrane lipoprotein carrier protein n=1 Tax=Leeia speluncae TaxID=2884804 RepID=A0ABS8DAK2_9NEIS|nr:outer membrane lipoprotein chaperone LolA [Leeia speluncae]MCB6185235.1 outer membrane lipoprotein chaperone LolA [Leeia speluncae]